MSYSKTITEADLTNILNEVLPFSNFRWVNIGYKQSSTGNLALNESINNFDLIAIAVWDTTYSAYHGFNMTTTSIFKTFNSSGKAFGFSGYVSGRVYGYINYVNDTTVYVQLPSGYGITVFGIKIGTSLQSEDYIVEQGSNSNGTYRKWNSGFAECWGSASISSGGYTGKWTFPCAFVDKSKIVVHMTPVDSTSTAWNVNYGATTTTQADIGRTPNTATNVYYMSAVGTWK